MRIFWNDFFFLINSSMRFLIDSYFAAKLLLATVYLTIQLVIIFRAVLSQ